MISRTAMCSVAVAVAVVAAGGVTVTRMAAVDLTVPAAIAADASPDRVFGFKERAQRDVQIDVWNQALEADPVSALALGHLAALHLQRAREGGPTDDYVHAEALARQSLALRTNRNARTAVTLTSTLLAQHRFTEALAVARMVVAWEPEQPEYRALLGEVAMEVGDDSTAAAMFTYVWSARTNLSVAPRLARWLELTNHVMKARQVMTAARDEAVSRRDIASETKAWFHLRVGDLELRAGNARAASDAFRAGLAIEANDHRLMAAMARLAAAEASPLNAIAWGERAIAIQMEPGTLGLLAESYRALGQVEKAAEYEQVLAVVAAGQSGQYHRAWSLFLLDRGEQTADVLARAQAELETRKDVYGYDLAAWAMHRAGRSREARTLMAQAMRFNTPDPLLRRHARVIGVARRGESANIVTAGR